MFLAYKYRIYPTKIDKILLEKHFGACRFVYNYFLSYKKEQYVKGNKISCFDMMKELTKLKSQEEYIWLNEISNESLRVALQQLDIAYIRFFKKLCNYPKYKSKKSYKQSCSFLQKVKLSKNRIYLTNFRKNGIKVKNSRELPEGSVIKRATISKKNNKYYIAFLK